MLVIVYEFTQCRFVCKEGESFTRQLLCLPFVALFVSIEPAATDTAASFILVIVTRFP